jgi:hypothetical protein
VQGVGNGCLGDVPAKDGFDVINYGIAHGYFS